jgi:hypothetical protein
VAEINTAANYHRPGCRVNPCDCWREAEVQEIRRLRRELKEARDGDLLIEAHLMLTFADGKLEGLEVRDWQLIHRG